MKKSLKTPLSKDASELLVKLAARTDALLSPWRLKAEKQTPIGQRMRDYRERGVPWRVGGNMAARKVGERQLVEMEGAGRILCHRNGNRVSHVKLAPSSYLLSRALADLPPLSETLSMMERMRALLASGDCIRQSTGVFVRDTDLALPGFRLPLLESRPITSAEFEALVGLEEVLAPALAFGWVRWGIQSEFLITYNLTDAAPAGPVPDLLSVAGASDDALAELYVATYLAELETLFHAHKLWPNDISLFPFLIDWRTANEIKAETDFPGSDTGQGGELIAATTRGTTAGTAGTARPARAGTGEIHESISQRNDSET